jgi:DNA-binding MarR family transcriptional regulator
MLDQRPQSPATADHIARLNAAREGNLGDILIRTARHIYDRAIRDLRAKDHPDIRLAHTGLLPHLDPEGTRSSVLAQRMEISKQAVGQLVDDLERKGYVERLPDPTDGRAKIVRLTPRGIQVQIDGLDIFATLEAELEEQLGPDRMVVFRYAARAALEYLEADPLNASRESR